MQQMNDRIDFETVSLNDIRREQLVGGIMARARAELARRAAAADVSPFMVLSAWARPALAAAAVLAVICVSVLLRDGSAVEPGAGIAETLVPAPAVSWLVLERSPTVTDLMVALEEDN